MNSTNLPQSGGPSDRFSVLLSPTRRGARLGRLLVAAWLRSRELPDGVAEAAVQITAELCANAATHGRVGGRNVRLAVQVSGDRLRVEVTDTRGGELPRPGPAAPEAESGRGLLLVAAFADRWGVEQGPVPRKTVWAELDLPQRRSGEAGPATGARERGLRWGGASDQGTKRGKGTAPDPTPPSRTDYSPARVNIGN
ncbi:ATP-binding protein [Streptomyces sp. C10-9-1]|uniref:ATP-binding protein n=1 Tax=Streptomyces sp. C10-9-1 TaxID=1859285 RepID=UPI003F4A3B48